MEEAFYVSRKKYEALVNELKDLKTLKAELSNEIGEAAAQGDLKENAEYHAAKEKQAENLNPHSRVGKPLAQRSNYGRFDGRQKRGPHWRHGDD